MTDEERLAILGADTVAKIRERVKLAPEPSDELVEELRRIMTRPAGPVPKARPAPTREQAIRAAAEALLDAVAERASRTPREAAEAAWYPGHRLGSVEAVEAEIFRRRRQPEP
ncbi:hypothetical protein [Streptomyces sp. UG1]|uniref:hypothetical protein n=1 Tax=Streptomyces sp. UG1 TaxID=3417652 RepID=UPI003CF32852